MKENKSNSLIEGNIGKAILFFVLPLIAGSLIQQLYVTVDAIIVGRFAGKVGLAAIDSINTLFKFPINFMNGLAAGATIIISRYFGAKATEHLHRSIRTAITIAFVLGIISSFGGVLLAPQLLKLMRVPVDIYRDTLTYCTIYFGGLWSLVLYNMAAGILRAFGDSKRPLYVLLVSSCMNILGDLLLVGVLHLGVGGAAAATVVAQIASVILTFLFLAREEHLRGKVHVWHLHFGREHMVMMINDRVLYYMTWGITVVFTFDFASSFRTAIDLKEVLIQAERAKEEVQRMQKRVEVLEAVVNDSLESAKDGMEVRWDEQKQRMALLTEERMTELARHMDALRKRLENSESIERIREAVETSGAGEKLEDIQNEMRQMRGRIEAMRMRARTKMHPRQLHMMLRNPSARSFKYQEGWRYLKNKMSRGEDNEKK